MISGRTAMAGISRQHGSRLPRPADRRYTRKRSDFKTVYDLSARYQVPGARYLADRRHLQMRGCPAGWRGIYDDRGRLMVAMSVNSDRGDSWEWADESAL